MSIIGLNPALIALLLASSMVISAIVGRIFGGFLAKRGLHPVHGIFQEAGVTILSLLLAFLYSASLSKLAVAHEMLKDECRAISSLAAMTRFLDKDEVKPIRTNLVHYVDAKLKLGDCQLEAAEFPPRLREVRALLGEMVDQTVAASRKHPDLIGPLSEAVNGVMGAHAARVASLAEISSARSILVIPLAATLLMFFIGIQSGMSNARQLIHVVLLTILVTGVFWAAIDMDRQRNWFTNGNVQAVFQLRDGLWENP